MKLDKDTLPAGHSREDFDCFGPAATQDGKFDGTMIADLGCFLQDGKDSNKYYHAAICQSKKNSRWYVYFEWGRTGAPKPSFQFAECSSKEEAQDEYVSQLRSKNDKRGEWVTIGGLQLLRAKAGKDCYLVRPQATRSTGLPDAKCVKSNDGAKPAAQANAIAPAAKPTQTRNVDAHTMKLLKDLSVATVQYTKGAMANASLPTQNAIDEARQILTEAQKRLGALGAGIDDQRKDHDLNALTSALYGRIPKVKPVGAGPETWVLTQDNILAWKQDLDAFESALSSQSSETKDEDANPLKGMDLEMSWLDPKGEVGAWLHKWVPDASKKKHGYGRMRVHNIWGLSKPSQRKDFIEFQKALAKERISTDERPLFQPAKRPDIDDQTAYNNSHTAFLVHGTRSVNVKGILTKSLILPRQLVGVSITGAMFGDGLYFADDWMKSAGYTSLNSSYWSQGGGGVQGRKAFLFLADVVLGKPFVAPGAQGYSGPPRGHHSIFGKAGYSGVANNEWIVFKSAQHTLRYLVEFDTDRN